ncbi:hypothetical protein U9K52_08705 [Chryseobacterium sp. MHB01]|uniref:hypothetical protein n=1 Tax=Chryseobacterium sp. MHB01 TaxID=3109433 RepID=UPI002AFE50C8|nr:hypothetical protein [Chryseobacterium sp. MHB01]MEA1848987.1 hypothetical protein [Chryseobacterium sp. MHB01]
MNITPEITQIMSDMKRYFNAKIIGSYILVEKELLEPEDINDIDIMVSANFEKQLYNYLLDKGFKQTFTRGKQIGYEKGSAIFEQIPNGDFTNKDFRIDVVVGGENIYNVNVLLGKKMERGLDQDYKQILKIVSNKLGIDIKNLQHFKDSSVGLYCTDKNPDSASKEDFFQLTN